MQATSPQIGTKYLQVDGLCLDSASCGRIGVLIGSKSPGKKPDRAIVRTQTKKPDLDGLDAETAEKKQRKYARYMENVAIREANSRRDHHEFCHVGLVEMECRSIGQKAPRKRLYATVHSATFGAIYADIVTGSLFGTDGHCLSTHQLSIHGEPVPKTHKQGREYLRAIRCEDEMEDDAE